MTKIKEPKTPHSNKWLASMDDARVIAAFIEWIAGREPSPHTDKELSRRPLLLGHEITEEDLENMFASPEYKHDDHFGKYLDALEVAFNNAQKLGATGLLQPWLDSDQNKENLIMEFFGVDKNEREKELRAMLDHQRELNAQEA